VILGPGLPIEIDAVISESHNSVKEYTSYPTEFGRFGFDNSIQMPKECELTIRITDTPMGDSQEVFDGRSRVVNAQLELWQFLSTPLILSTSVKTYSFIYLSVVNPVKTPEDGKSLIMNLKFVEIQNTALGLAFLAANLLLDQDIAHTATDLVDLGVI